MTLKEKINLAPNNRVLKVYEKQSKRMMNEVIKNNFASNSAKLRAKREHLKILKLISKKKRELKNRN